MTSPAAGAGSGEVPDDDLFRRVAFVDLDKSLAALRRILALCFDVRAQCLAALAATVLAALSQLAIPFLLGYAVQRTQAVLTGQTGDGPGLTLIAMVLLTMSVARGFLTMAQNYFSESVGHHMAHALRERIYGQIQSLSYAFHDRVHSGDMITVGMLDLEGVRMFFSTGLIRSVHLILLIGLGAVLMIRADWVLGLTALIFVPVAAWTSSVAHLTLRATWLKLQEKMAVISRVMEENLAGIRVVRAFAAQDFEMRKFDEASAPALELSHERIAIRVRNTSFMTLFFFGAMVVVLWVGGLRVGNGQTSIGTLTAVLTFMTILQMPVRQLGMVVNSFARASTCGARLFALLDLQPTVPDRPGAPALQVSRAELTFEDVSFRYAEGSPAALSGISFTARRGETIGLVGAPGSGKSTLAHLVPRFYDPTGGRVLIDGQDIREVSLKSLRRRVAVVQQDSFLFTTTIENNIAYGEPRATEPSLRRAAESAQLHDYVLGLPSGYGTVVGERGGSLSGGQRQRLSIARSLLLDPDILIFDDSTAAIDAGTEQRLRAAIRAGEADRLTLIIAHRLTSLSHADRILYLENGRIVEEGTHDQLVALGGRYAELDALQMRPAEDRK